MTETLQDAITGFGLAITAYTATNLDNFLLLCGLVVSGVRRSSIMLGFAAAGAMIVLIASSFMFLAYLVPASMLGYLGVIPIALGLRMLVGQRAATGDTVQAKATAASVSMLLMANSVDTIGTFAPMLAESEPVVRLALIAGYAASAVLLFALVLRFSRQLSRLQNSERLAQRITAVIMIGVGVYVLLNTGTDLE